MQPAIAQADRSPIAAALIAWHAHHGRHDLPWQREPTAYRVWVSETMLQQTQVGTVIGYYQRFMQRFPDVYALAAAPLDEVLHLWSGLGYYSRARNLLRAAQQIVAAHAGELPQTLEALVRLPGIGRSTAAAIAALAYGRRAAILDGNAKRVLSRYFGIERASSARAAELELWRRAEQCTPETDVATYTQAIMDLGATLCTRRKPPCPQCPLTADCVARLTGRVHVLPTPRTRAARRTRTIVMLLALRGDGRVLLERRAPQGVWGGLWTPPQFESAQAAEQYCVLHLPGARLDPVPLPRVRHAFTHFDLVIVPLRARYGGKPVEDGTPPGGAAPSSAAVASVANDTAVDGAVMEGEGMLWYNAREPVRIGLPTPIATLLSSLDCI